MKYIFLLSNYIMADKCPLVRVPIHSESSCGSKNDCQCNMSSNCDSNCSITTTASSQNSYQNKCNDKIQQRPTLSIAYLSNNRSECEPDLNISLNPTILNWCDFLSLFYRANNVFSVNPTNQNSCAISFLNQTYENTTSEALKFNLAQQIRIAWASKCETTVDNLPAKINILLNKDTFGIRSLINTSSSVALTLDQAIETLLVNGEIAPGDSTTSASVSFVVQYKYSFKPLNASVLVNFVFITSIPCYKNTNFCDDWCPPYSNDKHCRNCPGLTDETTDILNYLNKNIKKQNDTDSVSEFSDMDLDIDLDSVTISKLKELKKTNDDGTIVSMESSKGSW